VNDLLRFPCKRHRLAQFTRYGWVEPFSGRFAGPIRKRRMENSMMVPDASASRKKGTELC
jgi:hypothetical protein